MTVHIGQPTPPSVNVCVQCDPSGYDRFLREAAERLQVLLYGRNWRRRAATQRARELRDTPRGRRLTAIHQAKRQRRGRRW